MSMWGEVVESLQAMGVWQLLFAFVACTGYALLHGRMLERRAKWSTMALTALSLSAFVFETERWVDAVMLIAVGMAGLGGFVAAVWLLCNLLGLGAGATPRPFDSLLTLPSADLESAAAPGSALTPPRHAAPSH